MSTHRSTLVLLVATATEQPSGGDDGVNLSKSQKRRNRIRKVAVLKSAEHMQVLNSYLQNIAVADGSPQPCADSFTTTVDAAARLECKLDMFMQMLMFTFILNFLKTS